MSKNFALLCLLLLGTTLIDARRRDGDGGSGSGDSGSGGSGDSGSGGEGGDDDDFDRDITNYNNNGNEVEWESQSAANKIKFRLRNDENVELKVEWYNKVSDTKSKTEIKARFAELIEFVDTTADGYTVGEEVATTPFSSYTFGAIDCVEGTNEFTCSFSSSDNDLTFTTHLSGQFATVDGADVRPTSLKVDVDLDKSPRYAAGSSLALAVKVTSELEQEVDDDSVDNQQGLTNIPESQVNVGGVAFFSWADHAVQNGQNISVVSSNLVLDSNTNDRKRRDGDGGSGDSGSGSGDSGDDEDGDGEVETTNLIYFSFLSTQTGRIYWDPKIGFNSATSFAPSVALILAFLAFFM